MTQISRPFQVVLAVFAVFVVVWFAALRNHALSTGAGAGSSPAVVKPVKPVAKPAVRATSTTSAAHATGTRTQSGHTTVAHTNTQTSSVRTGLGHTTTVHTTVHRTVVAHAPAHTYTPTTAPSSAAARISAKPAPVKSAPAKSPPATSPPATSAPAKPVSAQAQVEAQLKAGKTVLILFWNPHGAEDAAVHGELPAVEHRLGGRIAVHYAGASQVGEYGTVTRAVQVNQTPTLLIVNPRGQTTVLTGLTDAFAIEQAVREAK